MKFDIIQIDIARVPGGQLEGKKLFIRNRGDIPQPVRFLALGMVVQVGASGTV